MIVSSPHKTSPMKKIITLLLLAVVSIANAQQRCTYPVINSVYQQKVSQITTVKSDGQRLKLATEFVTQNCVSSAQVKGLAGLMGNDSLRFVFCKTAYHTVTDTANFFGVYDAFRSFSWAIRMYDHVSRYPQQNGPTSITPTAEAAPVYPLWVYPDTARSTGSKGCAGPVISESAFGVIAGNVFKQPTEEAKIVAIESAYTNNCLSMAQMMKLSSMLKNEDNRMRVMKNGFARIYDQEHYVSAGAMFSLAPKKDEWNNYCAAYLTPPCVVSDSEYKGLLQDIRDKRFTEDKMNLIKSLSKDHCFNVAQLAEISREFAFDDEKIEMFKLYYAKCPDKKSYYKLVDELSFSSNKDSFRKWIDNGGK